jgi:tetratricopeptide (TPR) repeat protein
LTAFQARLSAVRAAPSGQQQALATQVMRECEGTPLPPLAAHSLLKLFEHLGAWQQIVDLAPRLPTDVAKQPSVTELTSLARSKLGNHLEAIAALQTLIATSGPTSEREGLLGGRYKKLYAQASGADRRRYLNEAITHYERGMMLDLNDYYPSSNLPRLYRERGSKGDAEKAIGVAHVVYHACLRARQRNAADEFLLPTLLGSAFDAGDVDAAQTLLDEITATDTSKWKLETTLPDLELSLSHGVDPDRTGRPARARGPIETAALKRGGYSWATRSRLASSISRRMAHPNASWRWTGADCAAFSASRCCRGSRTPCGNGMAATPSFACVTTST